MEWEKKTASMIIIICYLGIPMFCEQHSAWKVEIYQAEHRELVVAIFLQSIFVLRMTVWSHNPKIQHTKLVL